jgi:hypothetical protein
MSDLKRLHTGGCQCGAVRYRASEFGRSSLCHCRMCQKAFGGPFAVLVTARDLEYTRGKPKHFQSSDKVKRGFCGDCGTPLTYEFDGWDPDITVTTMDDPAFTPPVVQLGLESRLSWCEGAMSLPEEGSGGDRGLQSYQHPDHDTANWPQKDASE